MILPKLCFFSWPLNQLLFFSLMIQQKNEFDISFRYNPHHDSSTVVSTVKTRSPFRLVRAYHSLTLVWRPRISEVQVFLFTQVYVVNGWFWKRIKAVAVPADPVPRSHRWAAPGRSFGLLWQKFVDNLSVVALLKRGSMHSMKIVFCSVSWRTAE